MTEAVYQEQHKLEGSHEEADMMIIRSLQFIINTGGDFFFLLLQQRLSGQEPDYEFGEII